MVVATATAVFAATGVVVVAGVAVVAGCDLGLVGQARAVEMADMATSMVWSFIVWREWIGESLGLETTILCSTDGSEKRMDG